MVLAFFWMDCIVYDGADVLGIGRRPDHDEGNGRGSHSLRIGRQLGIAGWDRNARGVLHSATSPDATDFFR